MPAAEIKSIHDPTRNRDQANFTVSYITDGSYKWNCLAFDNASQLSWAASNWIFS